MTTEHTVGRPEAKLNRLPAHLVVEDGVFEDGADVERVERELNVGSATAAGYMKRQTDRPARHLTPDTG